MVDKPVPQIPDYTTTSMDLSPSNMEPQSAATISLDPFVSNVDIQPPADKSTAFTVYKITPEDFNMFSNRYTGMKDFHGESDDIEDILDHDWESQLPHSKAIEIWKLLIKVKDEGWRWVPAESVDEALIAQYLKERVDPTGEALGQPLATQHTRDSSTVVWTVKQAHIVHQATHTEETLVVGLFLDLEQANECAKLHLHNLLTNETMRTWVRYRFGNRFHGTVTYKAEFTWAEGFELTLVVWVEKETKGYSNLPEVEKTPALIKFVSVIDGGISHNTDPYNGSVSFTRSYIEDAEEGGSPDDKVS